MNFETFTKQKKSKLTRNHRSISHSCIGSFRRRRRLDIEQFWLQRRPIQPVSAPQQQMIGIGPFVQLVGDFREQLYALCCGRRRRFVKLRLRHFVKDCEPLETAR